jgi:hypothetical protein
MDFRQLVSRARRGEGRECGDTGRDNKSASVEEGHDDFRTV